MAGVFVLNVLRLLKPINRKSVEQLRRLVAQAGQAEVTGAIGQ